MCNAIQKKLDYFKSIGYDSIKRMGFYDDKDGLFIEYDEDKEDRIARTILRTDGEDKLISIDHNTEICFPLLKQKMKQFGLSIPGQELNNDMC